MTLIYLIFKNIINEYYFIAKLGKGDTIVADIETVISKKEGSASSTKYFIRKVHRYPKYPQQKEATLFDSFQ